MFGPIEREILTQALCRVHRLQPAAQDPLPCKRGGACANRPACESLTQRTLIFIRDLHADPRLAAATV